MEVSLKLNEHDARLLQACLANQVQREQIENSKSEFYYFSLETISKIEKIIKIIIADEKLMPKKFVEENKSVKE